MACQTLEPCLTQCLAELVEEEEAEAEAEEEEEKQRKNEEEEEVGEEEEVEDRVVVARVRRFV